ncbi:MAG TPA: hypothetical protein PL041_04055 [Melioribacteraceae bacterium]|nr:hypothetical protein [Melioribacteraceae bacterium]
MINIFNSFYTKALHFYLSLQKHRDIDLTKLDLIKNATVNQLSDCNFLQYKILPHLGINNERPRMFPKELIGFGLFYCQYPIQFAKYLTLLSKLNIDSYMEIGVRHGGTFGITTEFLKKFNPDVKTYAVDIGYSPTLHKYYNTGNSKFIQINSLSTKFRKYVKEVSPIDFVLIDADHTEEGCRYDYYSVKDFANIVALHDISNDNCVGVKKVWNEIKMNEEQYICFEFTEQYEEIVRKEKKTFLGLGVAIKRDYLIFKQIDLSSF